MLVSSDKVVQEIEQHGGSSSKQQSLRWSLRDRTWRSCTETALAGTFSGLGKIGAFGWEFIPCFFRGEEQCFPFEVPPIISFEKCPEPEK